MQETNGPGKKLETGGGRHSTKSTTLRSYLIYQRKPNFKENHKLEKINHSRIEPPRRTQIHRNLNKIVILLSIRSLRKIVLKNPITRKQPGRQEKKKLPDEVGY